MWDRVVKSGESVFVVADVTQDRYPWGGNQHDERRKQILEDTSTATGKGRSVDLVVIQGQTTDLETMIFEHT